MAPLPQFTYRGLKPHLHALLFKGGDRDRIALEYRTCECELPLPVFPCHRLISREVRPSPFWIFADVAVKRLWCFPFARLLLLTSARGVSLTCVTFCSRVLRKLLRGLYKPEVHFAQGSVQGFVIG